MKRNAIIVDDVTGLFSAEKERRIYQGVPLIAQLENQVREYGMCIWATAHEPRLVLSSAQNVNVQIMMPLSSGWDAAHMSRNLGLDHEQARRAAALEEGEAVIKIGTRPIGQLLVEVKRSTVNRQITVEQARQRSAALRRRLLSQVRPRSGRIEAILRSEAGTRRSREDADSYLVKVAESQGLMVSEIREKYRLTIQKEMSLRKQNVDRGRIEVHEIKISLRGRNPRVLKITQKGWDRLKALGCRPSHEGKGGPEHVFWQRRGKEYLEKVLGYRCSLERKTGNTTFDVFGVDGDHRTVGMEIAMDSGYQLVNIMNGIGQVDRLIVACRSRKVMDNLKAAAVAQLGERAAARVEFREVKELYLARGNDE